jgi:hypothetical protein
VPIKVEIVRNGDPVELELVPAELT